MFQVGLSGFRVFEQTQEVQIRPITLLTGGNSSGKTSFMAAIRMLANLSGEKGAASFNKDPFFLGSYDQIAHHRGGRYGRVKEFSLHYSGQPSEHAYRPLARGTSSELPDSGHVSLTYKKRLGQPALSRVKFESTQSSLEFVYAADWQSAKLDSSITDRTYSLAVSSEDLPPPDYLTSQSLYLVYFMESLLYRQQNRDIADVSAMNGISDLISHFRAALAIVPTAGFVGGPVRTRPLRTYDPTESLAQSEGSHVPSQMAQLARTRPTEWVKAHHDIVEFGKSAGLFQGIEVRRLGRGDSDPFQIEVIINGPRRNIVDVGYGVSQALPIIFELARRTPGEIVILQQPEVHLHPEAQAALATHVVRNMLDKPGYVMLETHSDFLIDRVRRHIREGLIDPSLVSLLYFSREGFTSSISQIEINNAGEIENPPEGYREFFLREQIENLGL